MKLIINFKIKLIEKLKIELKIIILNIINNDDLSFLVIRFILNVKKNSKFFI